MGGLNPASAKVWFRCRWDLGSAPVNLLDTPTSALATILVYPAPEVGCDPYRYNLRHKWKTSAELETLSFPVAEYDRRNAFVIDAFDEYVCDQSSRVKLVSLRKVFFGEGDSAMCSVGLNPKPLYVDDDDIFKRGSLIVEAMMKALI